MNRCLHSLDLTKSWWSSLHPSIPHTQGKHGIDLLTEWMQQIWCEKDGICVKDWTQAHPENHLPASPSQASSSGSSCATSIVGLRCVCCQLIPIFPSSRLVLIPSTSRWSQIQTWPTDDDFAKREHLVCCCISSNSIRTATTSPTNDQCNSKHHNSKII